MEVNPRPSKMARRRSTEYSGALTAFTLRFTRKLKASGGNLVFSPLSIYSALALVATGALGDTLDQFLAVLGPGSLDELAEFVSGVAERALADQSASGGPLVKFVSGVWYDEQFTLMPAFRDAAAASYKAETHAVNFCNKPKAARDEVNRWAAEATENLIKSILPPGSVNGDTAVVLATAIYFKGKWTNPFEEERTRVEKFYLLDGGAVDAPLMRTGRSQLIAVHDGFKVLKLPYRTHDPTSRRRHSRRRHGTASAASAGGKKDPVPRYSMCVFLPDARDGLWSLVDMIASSPVFLREHLPEESVEVGKFRLPKFNLSFSEDLSGVLSKMGLNLELNLGLAERFDLSVLHKAVIEVNEEGTEAAAVTACVVSIESCMCSPVETVDFVADHPFAFFVVEEVSGAVVFAGLVLDPSAST